MGRLMLDIRRIVDSERLSKGVKPEVYRHSRSGHVDFSIEADSLANVRGRILADLTIKVVDRKEWITPRPRSARADRSMAK